MNTQLQITCHASDWDASFIVAVGVPHEQRILQPRTIMARDLPPELLAIWQQAVQYFLTLDPAPDGWTATHIIAEKEEAIRQLPGAETTELHMQLRCSINRIWTSNGTTAPPIAQCLETAEMLAFFDTLTSSEFWLAERQHNATIQPSASTPN